MTAASHRLELAGVFVGLILLGAIPPRLLAKDGEPRQLPPSVERLVRWLPDDTENLIVARSVTLPDFNEDQTWQDMGVGFASKWTEWPTSRHFEPPLGPLKDCKIDRLVFGAKNYDVVSSFGSLRSENCAIFVFEAELGDAAEKLTTNFHKGATAVKTLVGREVFVYPSATVMEPWVKPTKWQATYFVLLTPKILLCATSDRYLETLLRRVDNRPETRALPDTLPEWKHVDLDAPSWMMRHFPDPRRKLRTIGLTAAFIKDTWRVVYVPRPGSDVDLETVKNRWLPPDQPENKQVARSHFKFERQSDGSAVVSFDEKLDNLKNEVTLWIWEFVRLEAPDLFHPDE